MELITIKTFDNYFQASMILAKLEQSGIECFLKDEHTVTMNPIWGNAIGGIKLTVKEEDVKDALVLLKQFDDEYLLSVKCPKCDAAKLILINKPGATNFFTAIFSWLFTSYAVAPIQVYQCQECKYETKSLPE